MDVLLQFLKHPDFDVNDLPKNSSELKRQLLRPLSGVQLRPFASSGRAFQ